jgi:hypothetical protein
MSFKNYNLELHVHSNPNCIRHTDWKITFKYKAQKDTTLFIYQLHAGNYLLIYVNNQGCALNRGGK